MSWKACIGRIFGLAGKIKSVLVAELQQRELITCAIHLVMPSTSKPKYPVVDPDPTGAVLWPTSVQETSQQSASSLAPVGLLAFSGVSFRVFC